MPAQKDHEEQPATDLKATPLGQLAEKIKSNPLMRELLTQAMLEGKKKNRKKSPSTRQLELDFDY